MKQYFKQFNIGFNKLSKIACLLAVTILMAPVHADWHAPEASYCLELEPGEAQYIGFAPLGNYLFPDLLTNGVDVRNELGEKIPFYLYPNSFELIIAPAPENLLRYVYFGFPKKQPFNQWDKSAGVVPDKEILALTVKRFWMKAISQKKRKKQQQARLTKLNNRHNKKIVRQQKRLSKLQEKTSRLNKTVAESKATYEKQKATTDKSNKQAQQTIKQTKQQRQHNQQELNKLKKEIAAAAQKQKKYLSQKSKLAETIQKSNKSITLTANRQKKNKEQQNTLNTQLKKNTLEQKQAQSQYKKLSIPIPNVQIPANLLKAKRNATALAQAAIRAQEDSTTKARQAAKKAGTVAHKAATEVAAKAKLTLKAKQQAAQAAKTNMLLEQKAFDSTRQKHETAKRKRKEQLANLQKTITQLKAKKTSLTHSLNTMMKLSNTLQAKQTKAHLHLKELNKQLTTTEKLLNNEVLTLKKLQTSFDLNRKKHAALKARENSINGKMKARNNKLSVKRADIRRIEKQIKYLENKQASAKTFLIKLETSKTKAQEAFWINEKKLALQDKRHVETTFKKKPATKRRPFKQILIRTNPFGDNYNFAACFSGNLRINTEGEYDFALNSTSDSCLTIDNKLIASQAGTHKKAKEWVKSGHIKLTPGFHRFEFYYQKNSGETYASVAWKRSSDSADQYKLLTAENFSPGIPNMIMRCFDKAGNDYPLIRYFPKHVLYLNKTDKLFWKKCQVTSDFSASDLSWKLDSAHIHEGKGIDIFSPPGEKVKLTLGSNSDAFPEFQVQFPERSEQAIIVKPNIFLTLWTPTFIYDDEILEMDVEIRSELPNDLNAYLEINVNKVNALLSPHRETVFLKKKPLEDEFKFKPAYFVKKKIILDGSKVKDGLKLTFTLSVPGKSIIQKSLLFRHLRTTQDIYETSNGLKTRNGDKIIPILHRLSLSEKRNWSFTEMVRNKVLKTKKVVLIGDNISNDTTTLSKDLAQKLHSESIKLQFLKWNPVTTAGEPLRASFTTYLDTLKTVNSDITILIPSIKAIENGTPIRLQKRILAAMIEALHDNSNARSIKLCTPYPTLFHEKTEKQMVNAIKMLSREYGIEVIDLNYFIRKMPNWQSLYRPKANHPEIVAPTPVKAIEKINDYILKSIP